MTTAPIPRFIPAIYTCAAHGQDLTESVKQKALGDPTVVASFGFSRDTGRSPGPQKFRVIVQCPGKSGDGRTGLARRLTGPGRRAQGLAGADSGSHDVQCDGTVQP
ncbi:hypothetical protein ACFXDE_36820 [Kitasatospora sp. NPDC059408]|uniref:hypothetical protein n=1 Tax=Kitasatospora sp. NPDC059408 TaxID=3346823 RepID=UPI0036AF28BA